MDDLLPSFITLSGFVFPAAFLLLVTRPLSLGVLAYLMVMAALCLLGGLMFAAVTITLLNLQAPPLANSLLVLAGAMISLAIRQLWHQRLKTN